MKKLLILASVFVLPIMSHAQEYGGSEFLGYEFAELIVVDCAHTDLTNLPRTLSQLGAANGFAGCVTERIKNAGFECDGNPQVTFGFDHSGTTLFGYATIIQNCKK